MQTTDCHKTMDTSRLFQFINCGELLTVEYDYTFCYISPRISAKQMVNLLSFWSQAADHNFRRLQSLSPPEVSASGCFHVAQSESAMVVR
jgi:hypothetical protein